MKGDDVNPNDDLKYQDVIDTLRQLKQVKAPAGFESDLMRSINVEFIPEEKKFWQDIFIPSRLVPAAALVVTSLLLIFVLNNNGVNSDNPLLTAPRERGDVSVSAKTNNLTRTQKPNNKEEALSSGQSSGIQKDNGSADQPIQNSTAKKQEFTSTGTSLARNTIQNDRFITAAVTSGKITDYPVNKAGLNFRQVNLSNEQKMKVNQLKEKMERMFDTSGRR